MKLYLDDIRDTPEGWERAYTAAECITMLETGKVEELSLDHDLGDNSADGYSVLTWLENKVMEDAAFVVPTSMKVHSSNPSGAFRMRAAIDSIYRLVSSYR